MTSRHAPQAYNLKRVAQNSCVNYKGQMRFVHTRALCHACSKNSNNVETRLSVKNGQKRREIARTREQFGSAKRHACHLA
jgi:hypothetical protein